MTIPLTPHPMSPSRIAIYCRKSSESDDKQCLSLPAQLEWATRTCARLGLLSPVIFQEARSAKTPGRPEFARMMALVEEGAIDTIVTWKADRLARNAADAGTVIFALESKHLREIVTDDGTYRDDADSELMLGVLLGFSAKYSKDLSKNIRRGLEEKWRRGEWSSHAPVGYKNLRENADRSTIVVDPVLSRRVQELFRLAATGNYSINALATLAETKWRVNLSAYRKDARKRGISPSAIHRILRNEFYYGAMRVKGQLYAGSHAPLVSKELFDRVQAGLTKRRTTSEQPHKYSFAFSGLIRCSACGRRLVGYRKQKNGREYRYYACSKHLRGLCAQPQLAEPAILASVSDAIAQATITRDDFALIERMVTESRVEADAEIAARARDAETRLVALNQRRSRLVDLMIDGTLARDDYDRKQRELAEEQAQTTLASHVTAGEPYNLELVRTFFARLQDAAAVFAEGSPDVKRGLIREIGLELEARDKEVLVHAGKPATIVMNRGGDPLWWWIVHAIRNYFSFRVQFDGLIASN
jgi:site-specific DNA recombinase